MRELLQQLANIHIFIPDFFFSEKKNATEAKTFSVVIFISIILIVRKNVNLTCFFLHYSLDKIQKQ